MVRIKFIGKTIYLENQKILVIGDLHLGYDLMLKEKGIGFPFNQTKNTLKEIKTIIQKIGKKKIRKIIFLGDIKHNFEFKKQEFFEKKEFFNELKKFISKSEIIKIKGNHDTTNNPEYLDYYIYEDLFFSHGDRFFLEMINKKIKTIIIGHIHPAVVISDKIKIKKEKFKTFLKGKYKNKNIIIVPSFFPMIQGTEINENYEKKSNWSIVSEQELKKLNTYVIGKNKIYKFGKYGNLN